MIGVLALQGNFSDHRLMVEKIGSKCREVRTVDDLVGIDLLIIPGGESTVISKLLWESGMAEVIIQRHQRNTLAIYGTCAGAILLSKNIIDDENVCPLALLDIDIERNAYGRQKESFRTKINIQGIADPLAVAFIRSPKIVRAGSTVEILAEHEGNPVLVRDGSSIAGTFHSECTGQEFLHRLILSLFELA